MIVKIPGRTPAQLAQMKRFFHTNNWVGYPVHVAPFQMERVEEADLRNVEHVFAKVIRQTRCRVEPLKERYDLTLEINPYICHIGSGTEIKVPAVFLIGLFQSLDLFSDEFEKINLDLL
jgi:hypothetical protein